MNQIRNDDLLRRIAIVFKAFRDEKGVTQEDVYNELNIHIGRIEASKANPTISTLAALCKYFDVQLSYFFERVEQLKY